MLQLLPEDLVVFPGFAQLSIPLGELVGELLQLFAGLVGRCGPLLRLGQQGLVEACGPGRLAIPAVGEGQPAQHMEQLTGDQHGGGHCIGSARCTASFPRFLMSWKRPSVCSPTRSRNS